MKYRRGCISCDDKLYGGKGRTDAFGKTCQVVFSIRFVSFQVIAGKSSYGEILRINSTLVIKIDKSELTSHANYAIDKRKDKHRKHENDELIKEKIFRDNSQWRNAILRSNRCYYHYYCCSFLTLASYCLTLDINASIWAFTGNYGNFRAMCALSVVACYSFVS